MHIFFKYYILEFFNNLLCALYKTVNQTAVAETINIMPELNGSDYSTTFSVQLKTTCPYFQNLSRRL